MPGEATRFVRRAPAETGLEFTNSLRPMNVLPYIYSGGGVAIGDYDADGLPDVYLVSQDGPNKLFRQVAPLRFEDVTAAAGGLDGGAVWGSAAAFADVDGDGDLDLYVCNTEAPNLLYQNRGDGTFVERGGEFGLAIVATSTGAAFADYDNDGDLDLYLLTNRVFGPRLPREIVAEVEPPAGTRTSLDAMFPPPPPRGDGDVPASHADFYAKLDGRVFPTGQRDRLLRNDGYARWRDVTASAGIDGHGQGLSATWWDCDGDGWLDLYVANDLESPDRLWRNRGDGTFEDATRRVLPHTAYFGMGSDFGDIDNDGRLDFCVADMSSTTHYMSKLLMGNMGDKRWFLMNADPPQYMRNAVFLNSGTERFLEAAYLTGLASTDWTWAVRFADLDDDGWLDFFATNGMPVFDNDPDVGAEFQRLWRLGVHEPALDLIRDLEPVDERNIARRNDGHLHFDDVGAAWGLDDAGVSHGAAIADLDRDGDLDIVVNNMNAPAALYENRGTGAHRVLVTLRGSESNTFGIGSRITLEAGGLTQSRLVITTRGYMSAGEPIEHFGVGDAQRVDRLEVRWPTGRVQTFEDLEVDRLYTIREAGGRQPEEAPAAATWFLQRVVPDLRHAERAFDDFALQPLLPHRLSRLGPGIACADVDGDGADEVWVGGAAGVHGTLAPPEDAAHEDLGAVFLDHDRDGDLDLFVVSGGIEHGERDELLRDRLYVNDGNGRFTRAADGVLPDLRRSGSCACAADFDRDGDLDLFVGGRTIARRFPEAPPSTLLRNDGGRFRDATAELAPLLADAGMVTGAVWCDVDGDGWEDLVVAAQWQPIRVLRNQRGESFHDATAELGLDALRGQWNGIDAADLDDDGDVDLVVTNLGLNTKYKADPLHPLRLYAHDFDGDGVLDVVESKYEGDTLLPVRGRSCSSEAMPFIAERFRTFEAFARASLPEIYGEDALDDALELTCNELRHLVLENRGDDFAAHPLPHLAQIAPGFGIGIEDFDGDGVLDIAIAHNFWSPEPETGRFDGGLGVVLAGRGDLQFEALPAHRSGVAIPGDATALAVREGPSFACATNDGPVYALTPAATGEHLAVRLAGPPGNPTGVGARVALVAPDGTTRARTIRAGAGYLSQSAPVVHFARVPGGSRLEVRWPDGETTVEELESPHGHVVVRR